jgi:uncharacterized membrane protein YfcA
LEIEIIALLTAVAFAAGFIDAIAGGGGLLTLPALLLAGLSPHDALGTNKGQSVFGSGASLFRYAHSRLLDQKRAWPAFAFGLVGAAAGAVIVRFVDSSILTPFITVMLIAVACFMLFGRGLMRTDRPRVERSLWTLAGVAGGIGFYDGFFGPGTGMFLIVAYALLWRDPLDAASANAKVVNFASNLASMIAFALLGLIQWKVALPMAGGQMLGGWLGAHVTVKRGAGLVRVFAIAVSLALVGRLVWKMLGY